MAERRIDVEERRARLAVRHHLATAAVDDVAEVARSVVALHSTDPASVYLSAWARLRAPRIADVDRALYEDRTVVRMLGMRRTMFVVPAEDEPVIQAACTDAIAIRERGRLEKVVGEAGVARDAGRWLLSLEAEVAAALGARGEATGAELSADVPRLRTRIVLAEGKSYAAEVNVTTRVLFLMASEGRIVRGRPKGSFISSQYRWRLADLPPGPVPSKEEAQARLVRRWLAVFGPGTAADLKWWTGWTLGEVRRALEEVGAVEVELDDGAAGLVLPDDLDPVAAPKPWIALLPALDPTVMGWQARDWYIGPHGPSLFDRTGNAGPTVWSDGRVVGGWTQCGDGSIAFRLLEDVPKRPAAAIADEARRLEEWIGDVRVTARSRLPTQLERELSS